MQYKFSLILFYDKLIFLLFYFFYASLIIILIPIEFLYLHFNENQSKFFWNIWFLSNLSVDKSILSFSGFILSFWAFVASFRWKLRHQVPSWLLKGASSSPLDAKLFHAEHDISKRYYDTIIDYKDIVWCISSMIWKELLSIWCQIIMILTSIIINRKHIE